MNMQLLITEKRTGKLWDAASCISTASYTTNRTGSPGKFTFTLIKAGDISFVEGDQVRFSVDGTVAFLGYVFTKSKDRWGVIDVTCYDSLRYLKANASYRFYGLTAGDILKQIAADLQIPVSVIEDTGYQIPSLLEDDQSCLDIIEEAIEQTLLNTGKIYVLYDDGNGLCLQEAANMKSSTVLGDRSLVTDYTYKTDIDQQTYNSIKLARENEETGGADVVEVFDSQTIASWGLLRLYQTVDGDLNTAQMANQAETMLAYYNRRLRTLSAEALGVLGLRAGMMVLMKIKGLGDIDLDQYVLLEKVTHTFENDIHTMSFETMAI